MEAAVAAAGAAEEQEQMDGKIVLGTMDRLYIAISGLIGAGKSTLCRSLAEHLNLDDYYEPVEQNEYLEQFYKDQKSFAFPMQIYLLNKRIAQQQRIAWSERGVVQDRSIYEDRVFCRWLVRSGAMTEQDYRTYNELVKNVSNTMRSPSIIVHLDVSPEESLRRIRARGRECESGITLEYLTMLHEEYQKFIREISKVIPVFRVDWSEFQSTEDVARAITQRYKDMYHIHNISFP